MSAAGEIRNHLTSAYANVLDAQEHAEVQSAPEEVRRLIDAAAESVRRAKTKVALWAES